MLISVSRHGHKLNEPLDCFGGLIQGQRAGGIVVKRQGSKPPASPRWEDRLTMCRDIAAAVGDVHDAGVTHNDIKVRQHTPMLVPKSSSRRHGRGPSSERWVHHVCTRVCLGAPVRSLWERHVVLLGCWFLSCHVPLWISVKTAWAINEYLVTHCV